MIPTSIDQNHMVFEEVGEHGESQDISEEEDDSSEFTSHHDCIETVNSSDQSIDI